MYGWLRLALGAFLLGVPPAFALDAVVTWQDPNSSGLVERWEVEWKNPTTVNSATVTPPSVHEYTLVNVAPGALEVKVRSCAQSCSAWRVLSTKVPAKPTSPGVSQ